MRSFVTSGVLAAFATLAACSSTQAPAPQPAPIVVAPAPAPAPPPPAPPQHAEAHLQGGHITLEHQITFEYDSDQIQEAQSQGVLADLISLLRENAQIRRVRVEGHTDNRGNASHNTELSQRRAQAVAAYLRSHGFDSIQFEAVGNGSSTPLCTEDVESCHDRNRRVEFTIIDPPAAQ